MSKNRYFDEFTDYDSLKNQYLSLKIKIDVSNEMICEYPSCQKKLQSEIKDCENRIAELEAILENEPVKPILPPTSSLIKLSGIIDEISIIKVVGYFQEREYDPEAFAKHEESEQVGALVLAMIGNTAGSAVTSQSSVRVKSYCDFVRGRINGKPFYGWLGKTYIQAGDYVEMAAMEKNEEYVIYAVTHPDRRTISVTPNCDQGLNGYIRSCRLYLQFIIIFFILLFLIPLAWHGDLTLRMLMYIGLFGVLAEPIIYFISDRLERKNPKQNYVLAGLIFEALGFKNPTEVDLIKITKKKLKSKNIMIKKNDPTWPDRACTVNYYYYY
ncbi:putative type VI secretion system effector [Hafnia alvei]|uniref:putative type VI secretion system effector n=1 Tax=Hafnia alvei TaxID=569 RepID=UPI00345DF4CE